MGEAAHALRLRGLFRHPADREQLTAPRDSWRCRSCGWVNVFEEVGHANGNGKPAVTQAA